MWKTAQYVTLNQRGTRQRWEGGKGGGSSCIHCSLYMDLGYQFSPLHGQIEAQFIHTNT